MQMRNVGASGLRVSLIGLGCNNFGASLGMRETRTVVHKALDLGITLFDTADYYGERGRSEKYLGKILGTRRQDVVIATKFGMPMGEGDSFSGASRRYIKTAIDASLKRLGTDWIDLYQLHRPDPLTPIEETLETLDELRRAGKIRYIGCSNFAAWQFVEAEWTARSLQTGRFVSCQDEFNIIARGIERELVPAMKAYRVGLLPYFPLACGFLTGKYKEKSPAPPQTRFAQTKHLAERYLTKANWRTLKRLEVFSAERQRTVLELAFAWLASKSFVASVIAGATTPSQVQQNVGAAKWTLTEQEMNEIEILLKSLHDKDQSGR